MNTTIRTRFEQTRIVAVLVLDSPDDVPALADALQGGGIHAVELTLRTDSALAALAEMRRRAPDIFLGAGTVLTPDQIPAVIDAGADFAVSPGCCPRVLKAARDAGLFFAPGIMTPSDIEAALEYDCRLLKYFPAESSGGLTHLKSMAAPYQHLGLKFIPLGGLNTENMSAYLASPLIAAIGGSWIAPRNLIQEGDWREIRQRAASARAQADALNDKETS